MESLGAIVAGLGLFFIGVKEVGRHLKQMSSRRMRGMLARVTGNRLKASVLGTIMGALTQSTNAATFLVISMVTAGMVEIGGALPIALWANVGTSALVLLATIDIRLLVFFLLGLVGLCYYFGLNEHERFRHLIGAVLGISLLFLGLSLIKSGAAPLRDQLWMQEFLRFSSKSLWLALFAGAILTLVAQSSATVSVVAVTLLSAGLLTMDQTVILVFGASLGSGANIYLMSMNLTGTGRVIALLQVWLKCIGVLLLLPLFLFEIKLGVPGIKSCAGWLGSTPADQVAWIYLFLQLVPAVVMTLLSAPAQRLARKFSPLNLTEQLSRPEFIYDQAVEEAESALDLVTREHARLIRRLPQILDPVRPDEAPDNTLSSKALHEASIMLGNEIAEFLDRLMGYCQTHTSMERMIHIRSCHGQLRQLYDTGLELASTLDQPFGAPLLNGLRGQLIEGLHTVLMVFADCADSDPEMRDMLETITSDRSDLMKQTRSQLLQSHLQMNTETQARLFLATSLFERMIWLVHRYAELMERNTSILADK